MRLGLGLAALGRPGYINIGHARDLGSTDVAAMEQRCHAVLDAAWAAGMRWFDTARSYGRAEEFLASWIAKRTSHERHELTISSKWGYRYTANWQVTAEHHEVKDHSLAALEEQIVESRALLGDALDLYEVHSVTPESPILDDRAVLERLGELRDEGLAIGLSVSGPRQRETLERALAIRIDGAPLWSTVQATWNVLERSVEPALRAAHDQGVRVMIKEALANGRLVESPGDAIALAAVLAQPFVDVVLSGAVSVEQLASNLRAFDVVTIPDVEQQPRDEYWAQRSRLAWN